MLAGESFAEAIAHHPALFPAIYVALVQVGEASGKLDHILELLGDERARAEALRRKLTDALQYPAFILIAAGCVLMFFILFVLPQFSSVLRDFGAKTDTDDQHVPRLFRVPARQCRRDRGGCGSPDRAGAGCLLRRNGVRAAMISEISRVPGISSVFNFYRAALFCRNLGILLGSDVTLTATLRILVDIMTVTGGAAPWMATADRVRHGGKLSEALAATAILPPMAIRMLRIGEETGQLATLAGARRRILRGQAAAQPRPGGRASSVRSPSSPSASWSAA